MGPVAAFFSHTGSQIWLSQQHTDTTARSLFFIGVSFRCNFFSVFLVNRQLTGLTALTKTLAERSLTAEVTEAFPPRSIFCPFHLGISDFHVLVQDLKAGAESNSGQLRRVARTSKPNHFENCKMYYQNVNKCERSERNTRMNYNKFN